MSNWPQYSGGEPDRSDRNVVQHNTISATSSESIDIKEGTTGGLVIGNVMDGSGMTGADSLVDVKGNDGRVVNWAIETAGPNALARRGVRKTDLPTGIEIVVKGYRAKNGTATANASTLTLPDGRELIAQSSGTGAPNDPGDKTSK